MTTADGWQRCAWWRVSLLSVCCACVCGAVALCVGSVSGAVPTALLSSLCSVDCASSLSFLRQEGRKPDKNGTHKKAQYNTMRWRHFEPLRLVCCEPPGYAFQNVLVSNLCVHRFGGGVGPMGLGGHFSRRRCSAAMGARMRLLPHPHSKRSGRIAGHNICSHYCWK